MATLKEISNLTGLSSATVSRILNNDSTLLKMKQKERF